MSQSYNLVVLSFEGIGQAIMEYEQLQEMEKKGELQIKDAVVVEREDAGRLLSTPGSTGTGTAPVSLPSGSEQPDAGVRIIQMEGKKGKFATIGGGVGLLAGMLLGGPIGGLIVGAGIGAVTAAMKDFGIDDKTIKTIGGNLTPGSSALFLLGSAKDRDAAINLVRQFNPKVVMTSLPPEAAQLLRGQLED
jgi:uncharacterized membrane protein